MFEAYIPHPISGWTPDLNARTWQRVAAVTQRCRDLQLGAARRLAAEWLLDRAESIASASIEGIRPSARKVARAEARLELFGERPADDEMQALRNIGVTAHAGQHRIRPSSAAFRLLAHLPTTPVVTAGSAQRLLGSTERTARNAVSRLAEAGILAQRSAGRRNRVFECVTMMDAFTEASRDQPADNLTLLPAPGPRRAVSPTGAGRSPSADGDARLCNVATARGHRRTHPRPRPGGSCPAGHSRPA